MKKTQRFEELTGLIAIDFKAMHITISEFRNSLRALKIDLMA